MNWREGKEPLGPFLPCPLSSTTLQGSQLTVKSPREHEAFQPEAQQLSSVSGKGVGRGVGLTRWVGGERLPPFAQLPCPPALGKKLAGQGAGGAMSGLSMFPTQSRPRGGAHPPPGRGWPGRWVGHSTQLGQGAADGNGDYPEQPWVASGSHLIPGD